MFRNENPVFQKACHPDVEDLENTSWYIRDSSLQNDIAF